MGGSSHQPLTTKERQDVTKALNALLVVYNQLSAKGNRKMHSLDSIIARLEAFLR